jgi:Na+/proline symporter
MSTNSAILVGLIIYGCLMLGVSLFFRGRVTSASDCLVAGRGLPSWVLSGTIVGTGGGRSGGGGRERRDRGKQYTSLSK